ncbi:MAG: hypothetical protein ABIJ82_02420 [Patescibacteria group bacterium]
MNILRSFLSKPLLKYLKISAVILVLACGTFKRVLDFPESGKDYRTYISAIETFLSGGNLYQQTIESYKNAGDIGGHGYAYFPGFLYLFTFLYALAPVTQIPYYILWKIPVLLCDLGVAIILFKHLYKKNYFAGLFALTAWIFNPYMAARSGYSLVDPIPVFFILLSLIYLEKDDVLTASFFTLSVIFKPIALIFLPLFLIKSKKWYQFVLACGIIFIIVSIPFILGLKEITTYLNGTLLVHSNRVLQGRPFLFYISYFYKIELFQIIPLSVYNKLATFFGWVLILAGYFLFKIKNKYTLASLSALNFLIFTPVLNRTYLTWFVPIFLLATFEISQKYKKQILYYLPNILYWIFCFWYLKQWEDGFHVWHP